jgi:hypothetical protein
VFGVGGIAGDGKTADLISDMMQSIWTSTGDNDAGTAAPPPRPCRNRRL